MYDPARFWAKVDRDAPGGCWEWQAYRNPKGYGMVMYDGNSRLAHRVSYMLTVGEIPPGLHLDHLCFNKRCVNPAHLEPVTPAENHRRAVAAGRMVYHYGKDHHNGKKTHCPHGHEMTPENVWYGSNRARRCRTCRDIYDAARRPVKIAYLKAYRERKRQEAAA